MALYTISTSGNLEFAETGLGNPVSTFANEGIATGAIASSPISGNNPKIWTIGPPNYFTSSGSLVVVSVNLSTQSGLAASSIAEYPISGIVDNIPQVQVTLGFITAAEESHGNLVVTGTSVSTQRFNVNTAGNLVISGNSVYPSTRKFQSSGNLKINGTSVYPSTRKFQSSGNLKITTADAYSIKLKETTAGNLVISGTDFVKKVYNKTSSGNLVVSGTTVQRSTRNETTRGNLVVVDKAYNTLYTGGIADNPIASFPIAAGSSSATVQQVQISFYGNINSSGNLVITSNGEFVNSLSHSSGIAGAALADQTIGGGMDTVFRSTGYQTTLDFSTNGNLVISGYSGSSNDYRSSGNLVISGTDEVHRALNFTTSGNLVVTGSTVQSSRRNERTSGNLVITPVGQYTNPLSSSSGIAGAALADQTIGGGKDTNYYSSRYQDLWIEATRGNLVISGYTGINNDYRSSGNLIISGTSTLGKTYNFSSSGNLVVTGSDYQSRTIAENSSGNLLIFSVIRQPLSSSSGIAGAALADQPIAGGKDQLYSEYQDLWIEPTRGNLVITGSDYQSRTIVERSSGNLAISGTTVVARELDFLSRGNLVITGSDYQSRIIAERTSGNLVITPVGQYTNPLSSSSGIAGAALADQTIGGGKDTNYYSSRYQDLWIESTRGNLVISGTTVQRSLRNETTRGNLVISGTDTQSSTRKESTRGNLVINGTTATNKTLDFVSRGNLVITPVGWKSTDTISGTIAGSALATTPIGGDEMENHIAVVQVSYISRGRYYPGNIAYTTTAGQLLISGTTTYQFITAGSEVSTGNLVVSGTTVQRSLRKESTSGNLIITGTTVQSRTIAELTRGNLVVSGTTVQSSTRKESTSGNLIISGTTVIARSVDFNTSGNLVISGTDAYNLSRNRQSSGNLVISGTDTVEVTANLYSSGNLVISGTDNVGRTVTFSSAGNLLISGYSGQGYAFATSGNLVISGTTVAEYIPGNQNISSNGNLIISGTATAQFIPAQRPAGQGGGGSYIFPSSWDILTPYLPDDRLILGYRKAETSGIGELRSFGFSEITVVRGTSEPAPKKSTLLSKYIQRIEDAKAKQPAKQIPAPTVVLENFKLKQALMEDEMLLNGSLLEVDTLQQELDRELLL